MAITAPNSYGAVKKYLATVRRLFFFLVFFYKKKVIYIYIFFFKKKEKEKKKERDGSSHGNSDTCVHRTHLFIIGQYLFRYLSIQTYVYDGYAEFRTSVTKHAHGLKKNPLSTSHSFFVCVAAYTSYFFRFCFFNSKKKIFFSKIKKTSETFRIYDRSMYIYIFFFQN